MLDYVMEFLVANGVQEVFIFCVNKKEMVEEYMQNSKWSSSVMLRCISSAKCMGAGMFACDILCVGVCVCRCVGMGVVGVGAEWRRGRGRGWLVLDVSLSSLSYSSYSL
jgi:hypothetical protein